MTSAEQEGTGVRGAISELLGLGDRDTGDRHGTSGDPTEGHDDAAGRTDPARPAPQDPIADDGRGRADFVAGTDGRPTVAADLDPAGPGHPATGRPADGITGDAPGTNADTPATARLDTPPRGRSDVDDQLDRPRGDGVSTPDEHPTRADTGPAAAHGSDDLGPAAQTPVGGPAGPGTGELGAGPSFAGSTRSPDSEPAGTRPDPTPASGPVGSPDAVSGTDETGRERLVSRERADSYGTRWDQVKGAFVDEPRRAVTEADSLVGELLDELQTLFTAQRRGLEHGLDTDGATTEDLRLALRRYRSFFDRLLSI